MFTIITLLVVLDVILLSQSATIQSYTNSTEIERSYLRTMSVIEHRTSYGRSLLLICRRRKGCQKPRATIPQWIREVNDYHKYKDNELIHFHFYSMGKPLPFISTNSTRSYPLAVYIIAQKPFFYSGDIMDKKAFLSWLDMMDNYNSITTTNYDEITSILSTQEDGNCTGKYMVLIDDPEECPLNVWPILARIGFIEFGLTAVHLVRPLSPENNVGLFRRLSLDENTCQHLFLLKSGKYSIPFVDTSPQTVSDLLGELIPPRELDNDFSCWDQEESLWNPIQPELTELELIYYSGDYELKKLEYKLSYVLVGIAGGCAVCTLAFSIFWGLNGSAFAKEY